MRILAVAPWVKPAQNRFGSRFAKRWKSRDESPQAFQNRVSDRGCACRHGFGRLFPHRFRSHAVSVLVRARGLSPVGARLHFVSGPRAFNRERRTGFRRRRKSEILASTRTLPGTGSEIMRGWHETERADANGVSDLADPRRSGCDRLFRFERSVSAPLRILARDRGLRRARGGLHIEGRVRRNGDSPSSLVGEGGERRKARAG